MLGNLGYNYQYYESDDITISSNKYYELSVDVNTQLLDSTSAGIQLIYDSGIIGEKLNIVNTDWTTYKFYIKANNEDMFVKSVFPKVFSEKTSKAYKESATSYKKLFESKEFYDAIMKSLGNVIYRILNSDDTIKYSERSEEDSNTELKVAEDSEEYKITDKEDENG